MEKPKTLRQIYKEFNTDQYRYEKTVNDILEGLNSRNIALKRGYSIEFIEAIFEYIGINEVRRIKLPRNGYFQDENEIEYSMHLNYSVNDLKGDELKILKELE